MFREIFRLYGIEARAFLLQNVQERSAPPLLSFSLRPDNASFLLPALLCRKKHMLQSGLARDKENSKQ